MLKKIIISALLMIFCGAAEPIHEIDISIRNNNFKPAEWNFSYSTGCNIKLTEKKYNLILKEPSYTGYKRWYGFIDLGNQANKRHFFSLDLQSDKTFLMYFDIDKNLDLSDDGPPLTIKGGPGSAFSAVIRLPWTTIIKNAPLDGEFVFLFYSNEACWSNGKASHYSFTQLKGKVEIDDDLYTIYLIDMGYNDADLTNDGVAIDFNSNGVIDNNIMENIDPRVYPHIKEIREELGSSETIEYPKEHPKMIHEINGELYKFNVSW